jgi:E3 ubiquitin-protein ligase HECTD2
VVASGRQRLCTSLKQLLAFEGDVRESFDLYFQVSYDVFGQMHTHDLVPGGADQPVTNDNRAEYVRLYVKYLLEDSVAQSFAAFAVGFYKVCGGPVFKARLTGTRRLVAPVRLFD